MREWLNELHVLSELHFLEYTIRSFRNKCFLISKKNMLEFRKHDVPWVSKAFYFIPNFLRASLSIQEQTQND